MPAPRSHYQTLNVSIDAEIVVIEAAYRALMKKYHPDQGAQAREGAPSAADINEAFAVLRDPQRRAAYDQGAWERQKSVRLAAYQPLAPPPGSKGFGWAGWLVSLVLAGMIWLMANKEERTPVARAEQARTEAEPAQAVPAKLREVTEAERAQIRLDALAPRSANTPPQSLEAVTVPVPVPVAPAIVRPARKRSAAGAARYRAARQAARKAGHEKDFLEREGYIY
jgi:DnaJ-class molecular chaperone